MTIGELLSLNHLSIVTFHLCAFEFESRKKPDASPPPTDEVRVEAGVNAPLSSAAAQLVANNRETIWFCLDRGFVKLGRKPIWRSRGNDKFVPVNCNYTNDATGYSRFSAAASTALICEFLRSSCTILYGLYYLHQLLSFIVPSFHTGINWWIDAPTVMLRYASLCQITGIHIHNKNVRRKMGMEGDAKDRGSQREGGERRDGIRVDFALLRFILCLLRVSSYLTCALLNFPLHQVQPVFASDS